MAAGTILTVLANIPWGTVVENAPKVANGAAKLWSAVTRSNKADPLQEEQIAAVEQAAMSDTQRLSARLQSAEKRVSDLHEQMEACSALIKDLAEQNTLLIQRVELNRRRMVRLVIATAMVGATLAGLNVYLLVLR